MFEVIDSQEKAYWLGFLMADGCIYHGTIILDTHVKDIENVIRFKEFIGSNSNIRIHGSDNQYCRIVVRNKNESEFLQNHGCVERKSLILKTPKISNDLYSHFYRGYFDGDGCISNFIINRVRNDLKNPSKSVYQNEKWNVKFVGTFEFLSDLKLFLDSKGQLIKHNKNSDVNTYNLTYNSIVSCKKVLDILYKDSTIHLTRKYEKYKILKGI